jgi:hypothetical protein
MVTYAGSRVASGFDFRKKIQPVDIVPGFGNLHLLIIVD